MDSPEKTSLNAPVLVVKDLMHRYPGEKEIHFPDFSCQPGAQLLISGNSGVGKTTLLHLLSGLLRVQSGSIEFNGIEIAKLSQVGLDRFRGQNVGLVFQQSRFIGSLSAIENLKVARYFSGLKPNNEKVLSLLDELNILEKKEKMPRELSGGEQQRLAIARALVAEPLVVFADEPTSNLDDDNARRVHELLVKETLKFGASLVVVTHDSRMKAQFSNRVEL